jgi:hypothetical protein
MTRDTKLRVFDTLEEAQEYIKTLRHPHNHRPSRMRQGSTRYVIEYIGPFKEMYNDTDQRVG